MAPIIDPDHRGPLLILASLLTSIPMVLFVLVKVSTKWQVAKALHFDDFWMILATFVAIGQIINATFQVSSGVGQHRNQISAGQFEVFQKSLYVSQMFYITIIVSTKLATLHFLRTLARTAHYRIITETIMAVVGAWFLAVIFCIALQCGLPRPWNRVTGKCFNQTAFWTANSAIDITTQLVICGIPIYLLSKLNMPRNKKLIAMLSFTPNLTTIPLTIMRLIYIYRSNNSLDLTWSTFNLALVSQIQINYNVIACCIPFMRPLFDSLALGLVNLTMLVPVNEDTTLSHLDKSTVYNRLNRLNPYAILSGRPRQKRNAYTKYATSGLANLEGGDGGIQRKEWEKRGGKKVGLNVVELDTFGSRDGIFGNQLTVTTVSSEGFDIPGMAR